MIPLKVIWKMALHRELLLKSSPTSGFALFVVPARSCLNESFHDKSQVLSVVKKGESFKGFFLFLWRNNVLESALLFENRQEKESFITSGIERTAYVLSIRQPDKYFFGKYLSSP